MFNYQLGLITPFCVPLSGTKYELGIILMFFFARVEPEQQKLVQLEDGHTYILLYSSFPPAGVVGRLVYCCCCCRCTDCTIWHYFQTKRSSTASLFSRSPCSSVVSRLFLSCLVYPCFPPTASTSPPFPTRRTRKPCAACSVA